MKPKETRNFYNLLGVSVTATPSQINEAYKKKAREYHPDKFSNADAEGKRRASEYFADINAAYENLSDPLKRASYNVEYLANSLGANYETLKGMFTTEHLLEALSAGHKTYDDVSKYISGKGARLKENTIVGAQFIGVMGRKAIKTADDYLMKAMRKLRGLPDD